MVRSRMRGLSVALAMMLIAGLMAVVSPCSDAGAADGNWPSFHGYRGRGFSDGHPTPARWDVAGGWHRCPRVPPWPRNDTKGPRQMTDQSYPTAHRQPGLRNAPDREMTNCASARRSG